MSRKKKTKKKSKKKEDVYPYNLSRFLAFLSAAEHTREGNNVRLVIFFYLYSRSRARFDPA